MVTLSSKMYCFVLILFIFFASCNGECPGGCNKPIKHYEEFGCEPVYSSLNDCCPNYFNCSKIENRDQTKCYLGEFTFEKHDRVNDNLTQSICEASCYCVKHNDQDFDCAEIECPEEFGSEILLPGCYYAYNTGECCSYKKICPPFKTTDTCEYNGNTYNVGQKFYPETNDCVECICKPGFQGLLVEPFCTKIQCATELLYLGKLLKRHAPVYFMNRNCCLIYWQEPFQPNIIMNNEESTDKELLCKFGDTEYKIGDQFSIPVPKTSTTNIICKCMIPPLLTCIEYR